MTDFIANHLPNHGQRMRHRVFRQALLGACFTVVDSPPYPLVIDTDGPAVLVLEAAAQYHRVDLARAAVLGTVDLQTVVAARSQSVRYLRGSDEVQLFFVKAGELFRA